jgi:hypothetical protein
MNRSRHAPAPRAAAALAVGRGIRHRRSAPQSASHENVLRTGYGHRAGYHSAGRELGCPPAHAGVTTPKCAGASAPCRPAVAPALLRRPHLGWLPFRHDPSRSARPLPAPGPPGPPHRCHTVTPTDHLASRNRLPRDLRHTRTTTTHHSDGTVPALPAVRGPVNDLPLPRPGHRVPSDGHGFPRQSFLAAQPQQRTLQVIRVVA